MEPRDLIWGIFWLLLTNSCSSSPLEDVRQPAVSGAFYSGSIGKLSDEIKKFLNNVPEQNLDGELMALIVPHAGYRYSGQVAAYAYKQLIGKKFDSIIIIGPSHHFSFEGASVFEGRAYRTPLGNAEVDQKLARRIISVYDGTHFNFSADAQEHSVEVQIPFLQIVNKGTKIVPIVMGNHSLSLCQELAEAIVKSVGNNRVLLIASSDLSHYHSYEEANIMDKAALASIEAFDIEDLIKKLSVNKVELCGQGPVICVMLAAEKLGANKVKILKHANSGDIEDGDKSRVVGYTASAILKFKSSDSSKLDMASRSELLKIARRTLEEYLKESKTPEFEIKSPLLKEKRGAFVTLKKKGQLRGCIGYIYPAKPLFEAVQEMSKAAALRDLRFPPVNLSELKDIKIEISVLSPIKKVEKVESIIVGQHGLLIEKGSNSGLLLPQVPLEFGWSKEKFLEELCYKAGLTSEDWKEATLYSFTAEVFGEE